MKQKTQIKIPKMLKEVWKMKEKVYNDTKDMSVNGLFNYIDNKAKDSLKGLNISNK